MKSKITLIYLTFMLALSGTAQTYEVIKVDIKCDAMEMTGAPNTNANDFSPFIVDNMIYFSSDRNPDILLGGENNWERGGYINLYQGQIKGDVNEAVKVRNVRLVSERFHSGSHTGPASFSMTGDTLFVSQVRVDAKEGTFFPQIYYAVRYNNRFTKLKAMPFNNSDYSYGHPFYDSGKQRLYFSSNMPGGKGGKDIYYCDLGDTGWSNPEPLTEVNTAEDELFPFLVDNIFFYATNPNGQNGGLDIYWKMLGGEEPGKKLEGINSDNKDDFGIYVFPGMTKGYFSSNRNGNDDLFYFNMTRTVTIRNEMAGEFRYKNLEGLPSNITVQIVDENDYVLYETKTDDKGKFVFESVDYDKAYSIRALTEDELVLNLQNLSGDNATSLIGDEDNVFVYRSIGADNSGTLSLIPDDMIDFGLNEGHLSGQILYEDKPGEYPNDLRVVLVDEQGTETLSALTDEQGNFDFKKLSMSKNYLLRLPDATDNMVLLIYDLKGNVVAQLKTNDQGTFTYRKLNPDYSNQLELMEEDELVFEYNTQTIWGYFEYDNNKALNREGLVVSAYNENGELIEKELTDKDGVFRFRNLPVEKSLLFKLEETDENFILDDFTLYIYDRNGQKMAGLRRGQEGFFTYRPLGYDLDNQLSQIEEDNLEFILGGQTNRDHILVYFDSNQSQVKSSDMKIINNIYQVLKDNPSVRVEINAYADAKSSDEYNLILSEKRGDWIVNYLSKKGISSDRFIVNAYGESQLVDEDNDALNRRAEIHLY